MKAVIIKGTYHRDGVVSGLVDSFVVGLKESAPDVDVRPIDLLDVTVEFCRGCGRCAEDDPAKPLGDCTISGDDVRGILEQVVDCDVLVFATPIYELGPTAIMKRFMERMLPTLRPGKFGPAGRASRRRDRVGVVLLSSGAPYPVNMLAGMTRYPAGILGKLSRMAGCGRIYTLRAGAVEASDKNRERFNRKARDLGRKAGRQASKD